jgi:hypothetical protein
MKKHVLVAVALAIGSAVITTPRAVAEPERPPALATSTDSSVIDWNQIAAEATRTAGIAPALDPLHESRLYAMVHVAIHDALNSIDRRFEPYALDIRVKPGASPDAAVATAARDVLVPVLQQIQAPFDPVAIGDAVNDVEAAYTAALAAIPDGPAKDQGVVVGRAAAAVILAVRVDDGAGDVLLIDDQYPQIDEPGQYRFPEGGPLAFAPRWYTVTPFVLRHASQFLPRPPLDLTS